MTDELISKELLLKEVDEVIAQYNWAEDGVIMDILMCIRDMVFDQPTAYNIDEVVEQLETNKSFLASVAFEHTCGISFPQIVNERCYGKFVAYENAIEIVKRGGTT